MRSRMATGEYAMTEPYWVPEKLTEDIYVLKDKNSGFYMLSNGVDAEPNSLHLPALHVWDTDIWWHNTLSYAEGIAKIVNYWYHRGREDGIALVKEDPASYDICDDCDGECMIEEEFNEAGASAKESAYDAYN